MKWNRPKPIIGITDAETVKLDFDDVAFKTVKYWALRTMKHFKLGGFIIFKSSKVGSKSSYHVIFNRKVTWSENCKVMAWVSLLSHKRKLQKWFLMQCIKEGSTLRVSPKGDKPSPRIVYRYGEQDGQIREFLSFRKLVKNVMRKLS